MAGPEVECPKAGAGRSRGLMHPRLTTRQLQVLSAIEGAQDWSIDIAAHRLGITRDGVFYHIRQARQKCGRCANHYQLIAYHIVAHKDYTDG